MQGMAGQKAKDFLGVARFESSCSTCSTLAEVASSRSSDSDSDNSEGSTAWLDAFSYLEQEEDVLSSLGSPRSRAPSSAACEESKASEAEAVPAAEASAEPACEEEVVILLDWDDTLFPTSHMERARRGRVAHEKSSALRLHARLVEATLRHARALGRVAIITLAQRGWVLQSAAQFLPGLDLPTLLQELDIPVYYALEHVSRDVAHLATSRSRAREVLREGADVWQRCKRAAMEKCLRRICRRRQQLRLNVVSVGDSRIEQSALKAVLWSPTAAKLPAGDHPCKTVKLAEAPTLDHLGDQLLSLSRSLPDIVAQREDFDFTATLN